MSERDKKEGKGGRADSRVDWVGATASIGSVRPRITDFCHFGSVYRLTEDRKGHDDATAFSLTATFSITLSLARVPRTNIILGGRSNTEFLALRFR